MKTSTFLSAVYLVVFIFMVGLVEASSDLSLTYKSGDPVGKLSIITPYPKVLTDEFRRAFERQYPQVEVDILKKKTGAGIKYLKKHAERNEIDLFWVSAPDAMEILKAKGLLEKYIPSARGIPSHVGGYPVNDPYGFYVGFAASGYGIMWNKRYLSAKGLKEPKEWEDLTGSEFYDHTAMSSPSRSGTTHLTVEIILQGLGWKEGWDLVKRIGGNLKEVTKKSHDVPKGIEMGKFGAGIVIDYYGLGAQARRHPVDFAYPEITAIVPANIALITHAPNPQAARSFIDFLLSDEGQTLLLSKENSRLPLRPEVYKRAPDGYPNPFKDEALKDKVDFDVKLSKSRYNLINSLFDNMVTFNFNELKKATKAIHHAEGLLAAVENVEARKLLTQARGLIAYVPISEHQSKEKEFTAIFTQKRKKSTDTIKGKQINVETSWDKQIKQNYAQAFELAKQAGALLEAVKKP